MFQLRGRYFAIKKCILSLSSAISTWYMNLPFYRMETFQLQNVLKNENKWKLSLHLLYICLLLSLPVYSIANYMYSVLFRCIFPGRSPKLPKSAILNQCTMRRYSCVVRRFRCIAYIIFKRIWMNELRDQFHFDRYIMPSYILNPVPL